MVLKIKSDLFKTFIKKATANGLIENCKLQFKEDGLHMVHKDQPGVVLIAGILSKEAFNEYETMDISIKSSSTLISVLTSFKDNLINIAISDNMVRFMDENGGIDLAMAEEVTCFKDGAPDLKYDTKVIVKKSMIATITERNNIIKSDEIKISIKDKKLLFNIGKEVDKAEVSELTNCEKDISADFDLPYFKSLTAEMDAIVDLSLSNEFPSMFEEKSDKYTINYYLTAISEKE